jgi:hypothetical protein
VDRPYCFFLHHDPASYYSEQRQLIAAQLQPRSEVAAPTGDQAAAQPVHRRPGRKKGTKNVHDNRTVDEVWHDASGTVLY